MNRSVASLLFALCPALVTSPSLADSMEARPVKVAVYDDAGSGADAMKGLAAALAKCPEFEVGHVKAADIRAGVLDGYDVVILPGGMSTTQGRTLGADGRERVRTFLRGGGGYVGFCAGAYLASCDPDYDWSLNILNANVIDKEHWARGVGPIDLSLTESGKDVLGVPSDRLSIYYHQGPLLCAGGRGDLPAYEPLAGFDGEIAKNGAPTGVMKGTTAVAAGRFGGGRVLCFSPHPEMTDGLHEIVRRGVEWAARKPTAVEVVAHRGASADFPENTLAAFAAAWAQGADAAECDVFLSKDGHPVALHDDTTARVAGVDRPVADQTLAELRALDAGRWKDARFAGERIPTLAQVLAAAPAGKRLFVEVKCGPDGVPAILKTVEASGLGPEQVRLIAFSPDVIATAKKLRPDLPASWVVDLDETVPADAPRLIAEARAIGADGLDLSATAALDAPFAAAVKAAGLRLDVWTVNDAATARRMAAIGVDGLTTDRPEAIRGDLAAAAE